MKKYKFSQLLIYHNYIVGIFTDGAWEIMCLRYYVRANGEASTPALAEVAAKSTVDGWVNYKSEKQ